MRDWLKVSDSDFHPELYNHPTLSWDKASDKEIHAHYDLCMRQDEEVKATRVRVMWPNGKGQLVWRTAWRVGDNPPQATRALALAWAK